MKITIPSEYLSGFADGKVFLSRWKNGSLLLLSSREVERLKAGLKRVSELENGLVRFVGAGIAEVDLEEGGVAIPSGFEGYLNEEAASVSQHQYGLLVSSGNNG